MLSRSSNKNEKVCSADLLTFLLIVTVVTLMNAAFIDSSVMHFSTVLEGLRAPKYHLIAEKILYLNLVLKKSVALLF